MEGGELKFSWKIKNFSKIGAKTVYLDVFHLGSYGWKIRADPKGNNNCVDHLSIFLNIANPETLPLNWSQNVKFSLTVVNQVNDKLSKTISGETPFDSQKRKGWGWSSFLSHKELFDSKKGYLVDDTCIIKTQITMFGDGLNTNDITKEEIDEFFVYLNSVIFPMKVVSPEDEAKKALAIIEEALSMAPADLNSEGRLSQLREAFDVISSLDDCSVLTSKQKTELLSMKENFINLVERAGKAAENIKLFHEKELIKTTLDHKLKRFLIKFEKTKAEITQNEKNIATLLSQIDEVTKKNKNLYSEQKEMFKLSKELKTELNALVKIWPEYEAQMKAAEKEEKAVSKEWSKMQQIFSSKALLDSSLKPHYLLKNEPNHVPEQGSGFSCCSIM